MGVEGEGIREGVHLPYHSTVNASGVEGVGVEGGEGGEGFGVSVGDDRNEDREEGPREGSERRE